MYIIIAMTYIVHTYSYMHVFNIGTVYIVIPPQTLTPPRLCQNPGCIKELEGEDEISSGVSGRIETRIQYRGLNN